MEDTLPTASERVTELVTRLQARFGRKDGEKDGEEAETLRYVIYVRKSTGENAGKQERTIGEQTAECKGLAERLGLRWVEVIHEEQSAMTSDGRPKFRAMLNELKAGDKYQGHQVLQQLRVQQRPVGQDAPRHRVHHGQAVFG